MRLKPYLFFALTDFLLKTIIPLSYSPVDNAIRGTGLNRHEYKHK